MKTHTHLTNDPLYRLLLENTEKLSAREYLKALERPEEINFEETKFVPSTVGESGSGYFLVKWRYPKYQNAKKYVARGE